MNNIICFLFVMMIVPKIQAIDMDQDVSEWLQTLERQVKCNTCYANIVEQDMGNDGDADNLPLHEVPFDEKNNVEKKQCLVFVSLSMPDSTIVQLAHESKKYGAHLVLRGLKNNSFKETAVWMKNIGKQTKQGIVIDPTLFSKFQIESVPTVVLAKNNVFDKIGGNISLSYALNVFAERGELSEDANHMLLFS